MKNQKQRASNTTSGTRKGKNALGKSSYRLYRRSNTGFPSVPSGMTLLSSSLFSSRPTTISSQITQSSSSSVAPRVAAKVDAVYSSTRSRISQASGEYLKTVAYAIHSTLPSLSAVIIAPATPTVNQTQNEEGMTGTRNHLSHSPDNISSPKMGGTPSAVHQKRHPTTVSRGPSSSGLSQGYTPRSQFLQSSDHHSRARAMMSRAHQQSVRKYSLTPSTSTSTSTATSTVKRKHQISLGSRLSSLPHHQRRGKPTVTLTTSVRSFFGPFKSKKEKKLHMLSDDGQSFYFFHDGKSWEELEEERAKADHEKKKKKPSSQGEETTSKRSRLDFLFKLDKELTDPTPPSLNESTNIRTLKQFAILAMTPFRFTFTRVKRAILYISTLGGAGKVMFSMLGLLILMALATFHMLGDRIVGMARELFVRSALADVNSRLESYGLIGKGEISKRFESFGIFEPGTDTRGQELMRTLFKSSLSLPLDSATIFKKLYEPTHRIDNLTDAILSDIIDTLSSSDPFRSEQCPQHVYNIAQLYVNEYMERRILTSQKNKDPKYAKLTPTEERRLFWKGVLHAVLLESYFIGLQRETHILRLAKDLALKGCVLRNVPGHIQSNMESDPSNKTTSLEGPDKLRLIHEKVTSYPTHPDHAQADERFLEYIFGKDFCKMYDLHSDVFPFVHQIAPLVTMDLGTWTHPRSLADLFENKYFQTIDFSRFSLTQAEAEQFEMFNFMMEELSQKDRAYAIAERHYQSLRDSGDEVVVLPLLSPQESLRSSKYISQIRQLASSIPRCYKDTYGAYGSELFHLDANLFRNYLEIKRVGRLLVEKGSVDPSQIQPLDSDDLDPSRSYFANVDHVINVDLPDVISSDIQSLDKLARAGFRVKPSYQSDATIHDSIELIPKTDEELDIEFAQYYNERQKQSGAHSITVDGQIMKEFGDNQPQGLIPVTPGLISKREEEILRRKRLERWSLDQQEANEKQQKPR